MLLNLYIFKAEVNYYPYFPLGLRITRVSQNHFLDGQGWAVLARSNMLTSSFIMQGIVLVEYE